MIECVGNHPVADKVKESFIKPDPQKTQEGTNKTAMANSLLRFGNSCKKV